MCIKYDVLGNVIYGPQEQIGSAVFFIPSASWLEEMDHYGAEL